jgi:hypothetical protein
MEMNETLLKAILAMVARQAFPPSEIFKIVSPAAGGEKQVKAYNLCDGRTAQSEIGTKAGLDKGSLSRSISRWIQAGIVMRAGVDHYPMHIYPLRKEDCHPLVRK